MSYTPTTWSTGDTITASAMNKIENGIANAGGGLVDAKVWFPNSIVGWQINGDFASALQKAQNGEPVVVILFDNYNSYSYGFDVWSSVICACGWYDSAPNQIDIYFQTGVGLHWTANGVEYFD